MFYKNVNNKLKTIVARSVIHTNGGEQINDNQQKAELFDKFSNIVYTMEDAQIIPYDTKKTVEHQLCKIHIDEIEVVTILIKLHADTSPCHDGIHPRVLRECADQLASLLTTLFSNSLERGQILYAWREASVTPIFQN